ncbi:MAG: AAA family ATPase, partial [Chloroflexota bacterium]
IGGYAVGVGVPLGTLAEMILTTAGRNRQNQDFQEGGGPLGTGVTLAPADAGRLAQEPEVPVEWAIEGVLGRRVTVLLSAAPGVGKAWWLWALLRAMQTGEDFYGLSVRQPWRTARPWWRGGGLPWQGRARPLRVLWLTEEGRSFAATARRFGIAPGLVDVLRRDQVPAANWPDLVRVIRQEAWRRRCAYVIVDTVRAWCPQAEQTPEGANAVVNLARQEWAERAGLGVVFVHHDRKGGGEYGEGVSGTYGLVGAVDILVELRRVRGQSDARRMLVSRRFGEQDRTARLEGTRYVLVGEGAPDDTEAPAPVIPDYLRETLAAIRAAGDDGLTKVAVQRVTSAAAATVASRLEALEALAVIGRQGAGKKRDPLRWVATAQTAQTDAPPTSDPAYVRYLGSAAWAEKRAGFLKRAGGRCEACAAEPAEGDTLEVHHLRYDRVGQELPEDCVVLCSPCHRRAHALRG